VGRNRCAPISAALQLSNSSAHLLADILHDAAAQPVVVLEIARVAQHRVHEELAGQQKQQHTVRT
jgi:hypothetical protein